VRAIIPRRIIQTWKSCDLPAHYRSYRRRLQALHPEYELLLFTDEEMAAFVAREYPEFRQTFDQLPKVVSKTDLFRLLAVHRLGGFYLDLDVLVVRSFEPLRAYECVFPFERQADPYFCAEFRELECLGQFAFSAAAGHPFPLACAQNIRRAVTEPHWARIPPPEVTRGFLGMFGDDRSLPIYYTTGPVLVTRTYAERTDLRSGVTVLYACEEGNRRYLNWCFGIYGVHTMDGGWRDGPKRSPMGRLLHSAYKWLLLRRAQRQLLRAREC
jgi:hypothetical protein